ncbi:MAG: hypoxanthine phosphoribosyltransferase [Bacteroidia bacterium]|nr:hypoxanthine phosphoribosyltransferase [Bacteroidia bacterium]
METVQLHGKNFIKYISSEKIQERISILAEKIKNEMNGNSPVLIPVLNGAFFFASDLIRKAGISSEVTFVRVSSYDGMKSNGVIKNLIGINSDIGGKKIIIVEDIVDTGETLIYLKNELSKQKPLEIKVASLLLKPTALKHEVKIDYLGFEVPNDFLVGFGLDYDGLGRNLEDIYTLKS